MSHRPKPYLILALLLASACAAEVADEIDVAPLEQDLTLLNTWTTINSNGGAPFNEVNRLCRTIRVYVMQHSQSQWSCSCSDFMNNPSCQNATAWLGITNAACKGTNCAQTVGFIKQGGPFGLQYRASFTIQNGGTSDMVPMWEMKPESTPSQELTGEIFRGYWSSHKLERWVP